MSIPAGVYRVTFGGALQGGEVWECGFWVAGGVPTTQADATATAQLWAGVLLSQDASGALTISLATGMTTDITVAFVRVYCYPNGGPKAAYIGEALQTNKFGSGVRTLPNQCALVVSLRTGHAGRTNRGRMYLPLGTLDSGVDGQMAHTDVVKIGDAWALAFHDWNAVQGNGTVVVVSSVGTKFTPVSQTIVDTKVDIQRRRANKEVAEYSHTGTV